MQKKIYIIVTALVVLGAAFIGAGMMRSDMTQRPTENAVINNNKSAQAANVVMIEKYAYTPSTLKVEKGTTVTWTNNDVARHNVELDADQPDGGPPESPFLNQGESYSFTFNTIGTYNYHCSPHPYMKASVEVIE